MEGVIAVMEQEISSLERENAALRAEIVRLREENAVLRGRLRVIAVAAAVDTPTEAEE